MFSSLVPIMSAFISEGNGNTKRNRMTEKIRDNSIFHNRIPLLMTSPIPFSQLLFKNSLQLGGSASLSPAPTSRWLCQHLHKSWSHLETSVVFSPLASSKVSFSSCTVVLMCFSCACCTGLFLFRSAQCEELFSLRKLILFNAQK